MRILHALWSRLADQPIQRKILADIAIRLGLFVLVCAIIVAAALQQARNRQLATHGYQTLLQIDQVRLAAWRNQLAAHRCQAAGPAPCHELDAAYGQWQAQLEALRQQVANEPLQLSRIDRLDAQAAQARHAFDAPIEPTGRSRLQRYDDATAPLAALLDEAASDQRETLATRNRQLGDTLALIRNISIAAALLALLVGLTTIRLTGRLIVRPLHELTDQMTRLARREHDFEVTGQERRDEIGAIARALAVFRQLSLDTQGQGWIKEKVSDYSHLVQQATTHREFAQWLVNAVAPLCQAGVALFYAYDDAHGRLDLLGSYGLRLNHRSTEHYLPGEGLVGQCVLDRKAIFVDAVPPGYFDIDSGSGAAQPRHVAILPVLYRETLIGVLELACFSKLTPPMRQLLEELLPNVALSLENLNRTLSIQDLLARTQQQADELRASELAMRDQKAILHERNEALLAKTRELEDQSQRLTASEEAMRRQALELQASNDELRKASAELARASHYKSRFLASMSHELRTPLNSLLILSRQLAEDRSGRLDAEQLESAQIIHDAGNSLLLLINDILDLSKIEAGKLQVVAGDVAPTMLAERLRRTFAGVAAERQLAFTLELAADLPAMLHTDGVRLEQILNNLLSNAFKFTEHGTVALRIARPDAAFDAPPALRQQPLLAFTVSDTGIGIPADKFELVFNAFEQVDAGTSRKYGGTGLGLAISRQLARMLGGELTLHSVVGQGSRFTLLLPAVLPPTPLAPPDDVDQLPPAPLPATGKRLAIAPDGLAGHRVMLVDEEMRDLFALSRVLREWGLVVGMAPTGAKALQRLTQEPAPELLLIDPLAPGSGGAATLHAMRVHASGAGLSIIALSTRAMPADRDACLAMGADDYLAKPVDLDRLAALLQARLAG